MWSSFPLAPPPPQTTNIFFLKKFISVITGYVQHFFFSAITCAWFVDLKREITLNSLRSNTRCSFSASLPKKFQCMPRRRCLFTAREMFSERVVGEDLAMKRPRSPPCYVIYYYMLRKHSSCSIKLVHMSNSAYVISYF